MTDEKITPEEYIRKWNNYIDGLDGLGWNTDPEAWKRVRECKAILKGVVLDASKDC